MDIETLNMNLQTENKIESIEALARLLDSQFTIPGTSLNLGLDTLIGLIPGIGDTVSLGIASYIVWESSKLGISKAVIAKMTFNIFIDWLIGLVPIIGDLFDWGWKANNRNAALLRRSLEKAISKENKGVSSKAL